MRKYLPCLMSCVIVAALFGCSSEKNCTIQVGVGNTGVYTDEGGTQHQVSADENGNVSVPCDQKESLSMVAPTPPPVQ